MHTIKPLDEAAISAQLGKKLLVTLEEHSVIGGLGSAVAECIANQAQRPRQMIVGIPQGYPHAGDYGWMLEQAHRVTGPAVVPRILRPAGPTTS